MDIVKMFKEKKFGILKIVGFSFIALVVVSFAVTLLSSSLGFNQFGRSQVFSTPSSGGLYQKAYDMEAGDSFPNDSGSVAELSLRNVAQSSPDSAGSTGGDAEDYEVTNYRAEIRTRALEDTCGAVSQLKTLDYVVFERSEESRAFCNYSFKVEREKAFEILAVIENLNPRNLSENTKTIKKQVEDFTSEREILKAKQQSVDETLEGALVAYREITTLATTTGDAETLARVINSRIQIIERLTQERIAISAELDRLSRAQAEALDGLDYTHFWVTVIERKFINLEAVGDSWQRSVEQFFLSVNQSLQHATVNILAFLFSLVPAILYFLIIVISVKYGWRLARYIWKR